MTEEQIEKHLNRPGRHFEFKDKVTYIEKQEITVQSGANFYNGPKVEFVEPKEKKSTTLDSTDEDIHMAIADLYEATDEEGNKIFTEQGQWYAVYRVLSSYCNYPEKMTDFVRLINKNKWAEDEPLCKYDSIASISKSLPLLSVKVSLWQQYKSTNEKYKKQCVVAEKIMKILGLIE